MPSFTLISADGESTTLHGPDGHSVMQTTVAQGVKGIVGECGGSAMCATCHVYVDEAWREKTGSASAMEESMLDFAENVEPNSRLSCQIKVVDDLDGLVVRMPESQH